MLHYYLQVSLGFLVLGGVMLAVLQFSKQLHAKKYTGDIKVKDRLPVDPGVSLLIVRVRDQEMLLSIANKSVTILKEFPNETP